MGGHVNDEQLKAYYTAQCYTDSVMAFYLKSYAVAPLNFLVVGSFHSDYDHGLPTYLRKVTNQKVHTIRILDFKGLNQTERGELLKADPKFGDKASLYLIMNK